MANRLTHAVSPYLRAHADNPVDWWPWGEDAFAEAERRGVPVFISIGYSTCHWCHVMARESFADPEIAALLADGFVAIKVDREEHPDVDASYLAAASAFTQNLGWPLSVFTTPQGRAFFAGTYFPPQPVGGIPSFRQVLGAIGEAWNGNRDAVLESAAAVAEAVSRQPATPGGALPGTEELGATLRRLTADEDTEHGGFGPGPKFPVAPVLDFLLSRADADLASGGADADATALGLVARTLGVMATRPLRDEVEGGFFRYAVKRDWSEPHYERMLTDNAQLLDSYRRLAVLGESAAPEIAGEAAAVADGIADFLVGVLRLPSGAFAAAQNSESLVDGGLSEGGYYALSAAGRAEQPSPALADLGGRSGRVDRIVAARAAAEAVLASHYRDGRLVRAAAGGVVSDAVATLEDHGLLAGGLLRLALVTGEVRFAVIARELVEACLGEDGSIGAPGGADPVLASRGLAVGLDLSEGASPSGLSALADAALRLHALTGDPRHRAAAEAALAPLAGPALEQPVSFGAALAVLQRLATPLAQLVVVVPEAVADESEQATGADGGLLADAAALAATARAWPRLDGTLALVSDVQSAAFAEAGFELFAGRGLRDGAATAYLCEHFVCELPLTSPAELAQRLTR